VVVNDPVIGHKELGVTQNYARKGYVPRPL
jgi:hypothetical protein